MKSVYKCFLHTPSWVIISISILLSGVIGGLLPQFLIQGYDVSISLNIHQSRESSDTYYSYDGYYAMQAEELISENVSRWFMSPAFVEEIISQSEPDLAEQISLRELRSLFQVEQLSATIVEVRFNVLEAELGHRRAEAIAEVLRIRLTNHLYENYQVEITPVVMRPQSYQMIFWILGSIFIGISGAIVIILNRSRFQQI